MMPGAPQEWEDFESQLSVWHEVNIPYLDPCL